MSDIILDGMEFNTNSTSNNNNNNNDILKHLGGSFDNNHGIENDNSDDENDILNNQRNENNDNIIKKVNTPQRMFLTRRLSGMPVLPSNSFDMFDKTTVSQNGIDDDVLAKLNELIDSLPNPPTINHLQNTQNTSSITSTAVKAVSLGWGSFKGFASNLIGGKK